MSTQVLLIPALFNVGVRRRGWGGGIAILGSGVLLAGVAGRGERLVSIDGVDLEAWGAVVSWVLNCFVVVVAPYIMGAALAARRDLTESYRQRAEHAEAERSARAAEAVLLERARISREAHDVLGHKLSLLSLQAGGLELNAHSGAHVVAHQARLINRSARDALDDLRSLIGSIEAPCVDAATAVGNSLVSQDIRGIEKLVAESRSSGAIVDYDATGLSEPESLPMSTKRAAYRIVQECLTNAHKHAPGAPVRVMLTGAPGGQLAIELRNAVKGRLPEAPGSGGRGLPGLRERARVVGGSLEIREVDSVFVVKAELPWPVGGTGRVR